MKNNVITILVDSVYSGCIGTKKTTLSSTPFIDSMLEHAFYSPNFYSFGPYTDAATKGLYCANRTLSDYGYFFGINSSDTNHFRAFKELGYETYGFYYPYYLIGSSVEKYIDHSIYTTGFKYISVWNGKLEYYAKIKQKRKLSDLEYTLLIRCMELVFECWISFYSNINNQEMSDTIIKEISNESLNGSGKDGLLKQYNLFNTDRKKYINDVLDLGMQHPLAKVNEYDYGRKEDLNFVAQIYDEFHGFFKKLKKTNICRNVKNNPISLKKSLKTVYTSIKNREKGDLRYIANYGMLLLETNLMQERSIKPQWQDLASLDKQIKVMFDCLDRRNDQENPFYISLHALEPHHNISFFSYDCFDMGQINEELKYLEPLIDECGSRFKGSLIYQLSLRYVDLCIKNLVERLEERKLADNTTIMLVSDHGTSYSFDPVRTHVVNTFHKENYNVPLMIWSKNIAAEKKMQYDGFYTSADVFPTLFDVVGLVPPKQFTGESMLRNIKGEGYIITEYMGPGVPDMLNREVWMSARNSNYVIAYRFRLNQRFDENEPVAVYNLQSDNEEINNYAGHISIDGELLDLGLKVKKRFEEIKKETENYIRFIITGCD